MAIRQILRTFLVAAAVVGAATPGLAQTREIDSERSTLTVQAYKSGLFSAFAHDHVISAPIARGSVSETAPRSVTLAIRTGALKVLDPTLAAHRRPEVLARMLGPDVLDAATFPEIAFSSTSIESSGAGSWMVSGRLMLHGQAREVTFPTTGQDGRYRGTVRIKQRAFGIEPISLGGGTVKVKDEVTITFDIVLR